MIKKMKEREEKKTEVVVEDSLSDEENESP